jgi:hypothetical protein
MCWDEEKETRILGKGLGGGMSEEAHTCVDFDLWIADGATRGNVNGKGAGEEKSFRGARSS